MTLRNAVTLGLLLLPSVSWSQARPVPPVLAFPEPGIDDTTAYQGYQTRFYRDSRDNTVQIYLEPRGGRAVLVWADAANESVGFTVRDAGGRPAPLEWGAEAAQVSDSGPARTLEYRLTAPVSQVDLGWFVLGSMRVERDFVYARRHLKPFAASPFRVAEESLLVAAVGRLPSAERERHLQLLNAESLEQLRSRLDPDFEVLPPDSTQTIRISRPSLDGRNRLVLELRTDPRKVKVQRIGRAVSLRTRPGAAVQFAVRVSTDARTLTPLSRDRIFTPEFLSFARGTRRLERQVRGVELLSSAEKLMAGLPNFATYFGRDMMMTALMMRPIWLPEMSEHVIASVLGKLGPGGEVSHEEALGGQAIRENAVVYDSLVKESRLEEATGVLRELQKTRENYHMVDDEFQLPVLTARYLADSSVAADRKRQFLQERTGGSTRLALLLKELALVSSMTAPYVRQPEAVNLVSFPRRDSTHWRSASWRDSDPGYAGGRFAMDINAIWVPAALRAIASIARTLPQLGLTAEALDTAELSRAIAVWNGARKHFTITLSPAQIKAATQAKMTSLPVEERRYWRRALRREHEPRDSLRFLALSLDSLGRPILVVNTDPATDLFLNSDLQPAQALEDLGPLLRAYPVGLLVNGLGPLVANDAYASPSIWKRFEEDRYHSPRVVWGREVNLILLGLAHQSRAGRVGELKEALKRTQEAVNASGLQHNELWSYEIRGDRLVPVRYGTSSDVQLWNTTNLVVQYVLSRLPGP